MNLFLHEIELKGARLLELGRLLVPPAAQIAAIGEPVAATLPSGVREQTCSSSNRCAGSRQSGSSPWERPAVRGSHPLSGAFASGPQWCATLWHLCPIGELLGGGGGGGTLFRAQSASNEDRNKRRAVTRVTKKNHRSSAGTGAVV